MQMKPKQDQGPSTPIHPRDTSFSVETSGSTHFVAGWQAEPGRCYLLASVAGSMSMVMAMVVVAVVVEPMGRTVVLVVVVNAYTGHPSYMAMVMMMVMVNKPRETQAPAMEESRPGLSDSVSLHIVLL